MGQEILRGTEKRCERIGNSFIILSFTLYFRILISYIVTGSYFMFLFRSLSYRSLDAVRI